MDLTYDAVIVGAGAAGLASASRLMKEGKKVLILEARARIGGRIFSLQRQGVKAPIELGAEFIHGHPPEVIGLVERLNLVFYRGCETQLYHKGNHVAPSSGFWETIAEVMSKLRRARGEDRSVEEAVRRLKMSRDRKNLFRHFIQGFHAADLGSLSRDGLLATEQSSSAAETYRTLSGFGQLLYAWYRDIDPHQRIVKLRNAVQRMEWSKGDVGVVSKDALGRTRQVRAKVGIVTVPLGILKGKGIEFHPPLPQVNTACESMAMGHVQKLVFVFHERFWEKLSNEDFGLIHLRDKRSYPTWWSQSPLRRPCFTAWQGGPEAEEMSRWTKRRRVGSALKTLSYITGHSVNRLEELMMNAYEYPWTTSRWSLGAYSYVLQVGLKKSQTLSARTKKPILFAGEATVSDETRATVQGAMRSGYRAAERALEFL